MRGLAAADPVVVIPADALNILLRGFLILEMGR
jgi:hypothetical protein